MRVLDLFSGIGGFSLGLERAGMKTVAFCEIEPFPRAVLHKHWPEVPIYEDVRTLTAERLAADGIAVDLICGGFPCQDISYAGKGAGLAGERSGLWREYARLIGEIRPRYVIVENVAALLRRGLGDVLADLAAIGFDAEWHCIPASAVGAPHRRDRAWIVAYPGQVRRDAGRPRQSLQGDRLEGEAFAFQPMADASCGRRDGAAGGEMELARRTEAVCSGEDVAYAPGLFGNVSNIHRNGHFKGTTAGEAIRELGGSAANTPDTHCQGLEGQRTISSRIAAELNNACNDSQWLTEPNVGRVAHGVPARVDRLKSLGNAVVPQIPEMIGRAIMQQVAA